MQGAPFPRVQLGLLYASLAAIAAFFVAMQLLVLPPDGFVTGDQGSKFLQTRAFAAHGPLDPSIDVASRDVDPDYRHQEPKLKNRRGRLVSEFLWLLPLLAAPFYRWFGLWGLYVIPAAAVLVTFLGVLSLTRTLGDDRPLRSAWIVLLVTPLAAYGLELWEHAPATACIVAAAAWLAPVGGHRASLARSMAGGAAIAVGTLFREEVIAALPALVIGRALILERDRLRDVVHTGGWALAGAVAVFVVSVPMNVLIYGAPLPMHVTQDAWEVARNTPYLQVRRDVLVDLLLPASHPWLFALCVFAGFAGAARRHIGIVHVAAAGLLAIGVLLPVWRLASGVQPTLSYRISSAAHTWTFAIALLYWPWFAGSRGVLRYPIAAGLLLFVGSALVVPTSGGAQWSPRFMLAVAPLLAVAAARGLTGTPRKAVAAIFAASMLMQVTGVLFFVRSKVRHAAMTHTVAAHTSDGAVLISDVYWFPEVTATLASSRRFLFSWQAGDFPALAEGATSRGLNSFDLVTSASLTGYEAPLQLVVPGSACVFSRGRQLALDANGLTQSHYECREP